MVRFSTRVLMLRSLQLRLAKKCFLLDCCLSEFLSLAFHLKNMVLFAGYSFKTVIGILC